jgi:DNA-binding transcriptional LysR family regulator
MKRKLTLRDLRGYRHLLVRDSGSKRDARALSLEVEQRWTVSTMATSILAARMGYGFAWFPEDLIRAELDAGTLKPLPLSEGVERFGELYLILADRDAAGPGTLRLAAIIREGVASECTKHAGAPQRAKRRETPAPT